MWRGNDDKLLTLATMLCLLEEGADYWKITDAGNLVFHARIRAIHETRQYETLTVTELYRCIRRPRLDGRNGIALNLHGVCGVQFADLWIGVDDDAVVVQNCRTQLQLDAEFVIIDGDGGGIIAALG